MKKKRNPPIEAYQRVFSTPDGRKVIEDLRDFSGIDSIHGPLPEREAVYRDAMQDFYRYIMATLDTEER